MTINRLIGKADVVCVIYTYNGILLSHEKNELLPFAATWMDLENIRLSEVNQRKADIT